jgi:hypothetical protein
MTDYMLGAPGSAAQVDWKALYLHLVVIFPYSVENIDTQFGMKTAVRADIYDVHTGAAMLDSLIFPSKLVGQTQGCERGQAIVGRVTLGTAKGGQNAPWELEDPTEADFATARAYLAARPPRPVPSATLRQSTGAAEPAAAAQPQQPPQQPQWQPPATPPQQPQWQPPTQPPAQPQWQPQQPAPQQQPQWQAQPQPGVTGLPGTYPPPPPAGPPAGLSAPSQVASDEPPF